MSDPSRRPGGAWRPFQNAGARRRPSRGAGPILFATYAGADGGAERRLPEVIAGFDEAVVVLCPESRLAERLRAAGIPVLARPARALELRGGVAAGASAGLRLTAHAAEIRAVARSLRPRCIVAWGMRTALACAIGLRPGEGWPPVVFQHLDFLPAPPVAGAVRWAAGAADRVLVASRAVAADLDPAGRLGDRLAVAVPGIDVDRLTPTPLPEGAPSALLLGAIVDWKRPDLALEAVALAAHDLEGLRLVVAGHAVGPGAHELLSRLRRRAAEPDLAGRVEFAGALPDARPALREATCLLHCAEREPFGLVLVEAMASGRPVVAPAAAGPLEILDERCARLYTPGDAAAAAAALVAALGDREWAAAAGEHGRRRAVERFGLGAAQRGWRAAAAPALASRGPQPGEGEGLTLVTVAHNSAGDLARLLASVGRRLPAARVVVADAGSSDASVKVARGWPGEATVLELSNVGYGRAINAGVAQVRTPACIVLNPDVELVDASLAALAAEAVRPGAPERLLAPLVLRPDGSRQDSVHGEPVSRAAVAMALVPPAALPPALRARLQPWRSDHPRPVAWAVGCCVGGSTATLRRLGPFDQRIFLYGEDLELGLRAGDAGVATWWWPQARILHHKAHASRKAFGGEPFDLLAIQRRAVVGEARGPRAARLDDLLQLVTFADRALLKALARRPTDRELRQIAALRRARRAPARLQMVDSESTS